MLAKLIASLRAGEISQAEFAHTAASHFVLRDPVPYPSTDGNAAVIDGVSSVSITVAVREGALSQEEADAIYAALPDKAH